MKNKTSTLFKIFNNLSAYFLVHKVVSEEELILKIEESVKSLSKEEKEELEEGLGGDLKELILKSIATDEKISVFSPDLHVRINYQGEIFYCPPTHRYMSEDLEEAFLRLAKIRNPPKKIKRVVEEFMEKCDYQIFSIKENEREKEYLEIKAAKGNKMLRIFLFPSIKFIPHFISETVEIEKEKENANKDEKEERVIVVPTERTPMPFISFFREQDTKDFRIWVANVEKNTIDPFIGNPEEESIEKNFCNPEQARRAVSIWMRKMRLYEDI